MISFFDGVLNLLHKPLESFIYLYKPFWDWLVKHDKYVYTTLFVVMLIPIFI